VLEIPQNSGLEIHLIGIEVDWTTVSDIWLLHQRPKPTTKTARIPAARGTVLGP